MLAPQENFQLLVDALNDLDVDVRVEAAMMLGERGDARAVPYLLKAMFNPDDLSQLLQRAARSLERFGEAGAQALLEAMLSGNKTVCSYAGQSLSYMGEVAVPYLIEALGYDEKWVRTTAGYSLYPIGEPAVPALLRAIHDKNHYRRGWAISLLCKIRGHRAKRYVEAALDDENEFVQATAARGLRRLTDPHDYSTKYEELLDDLSDTRAFAALALGESHIKEAVPHLVPLLSDTEAVFSWSGPQGHQWLIERDPVRVCDVVVKALEHIGTPEALAAVEAWQRRTE
jgi:HEAT repeat protein